MRSEKVKEYKFGIRKFAEGDMVQNLVGYVNRERDRGIAKRIIEARKKRFEVGKAYRLMCDIPVHVDSDIVRWEERLCTCIGTYEHWALFEYVSPYSGHLCRRGYQWLDIREVVL